MKVKDIVEVMRVGNRIMLYEVGDDGDQCGTLVHDGFGVVPQKFMNYRVESLNAVTKQVMSVRIKETSRKYHAVCDKKDDVYDLMAVIRGVNADVVAEISGYGDGYYVGFECEPEEYVRIYQRWLHGGCA